ncbi:MarR family winged helix-turn-helix transcriptional regulator [Amycolatopsis sp. MEPSY49]|uniref:MarR family winged helix-turn-helix transcriptional regulator n=1 Tax=Amycolatopsis sp. MEPSY49 TaxID=3151600 RepID=UPI003EF1E167
MTKYHGSPTAPPGRPGELENALSYLQCVLVARRTRATPEKITWSQYDVLETLRIHGPMTPSAIGESLGISRQSTSKLLRVLKDQFLIEQTSRGTDRREQTTSLTEEGEEFLMRAAQGRRETAKVAGAALTAGEASLFAELCQKVADSLHSTPQPFPLRDV